MNRALALVFGSAVLACGAPASPAKPGVERGPSAPVTDAGAGPPAPPVVREVSLAIVTAEGSRITGVVEPDPPSEVIRPCAPAGAPSGWAIYSIERLTAGEAVGRVGEVEVAGLSREVRACFADTLPRLRSKPNGQNLQGTFYVYVSVR